MINSYDYLPENNGILLDLPFYEGIGELTRDQAKSHHQDVTLVNTPTWETIASGLGVLAFDGAADYIELDNAASTDLNFEGGNYSIGAWIRWEDDGTNGILIGRYVVDVSGWEVYLWSGGGAVKYLSLRHHHAGTLVGGNPRTSCYSVGWVPDTWCFLGISRAGAVAQHYRNGVAVTTVSDALVDPESNNSDLVICVRTSKDAHHYKGKLWRPRMWARELPATDWMNIFEKERDFFGV